MIYASTIVVVAAIIQIGHCCDHDGIMHGSVILHCNELILQFP